MIFITVGTQPQKFSRLFNEVVRLKNENILTDKIIAQVGPNKIDCDGIVCFDFLPSSKMIKLMKDASLIISHGGTGSIITALKLGKKVIGVPRLAKFDEHINDHQIDLIEQLSKDNYILPLYDISNLYTVIQNSKSFVPTKFVSGTENMITEIRNFINNDR